MLSLGLMSGTSADGITAALVRFRSRTSQVLRLRTVPYAPALRRRILLAATMRAPELSRLNVELGEAFARAARTVMGNTRGIAVIGSHGQTVWHGPDQSPPHTLQLAEPSIIAERTGIAVVADFRPRDMAAGGQGAPLVAAFDEFLFARGPLRALQNIGGIANVSIAGRGRLWSAFDTGPGNCLMDAAVRLGTAGASEMDTGGRLAASGRADARLVAHLLQDPYFRATPPKSLERTWFSEKFLRRAFGRIGPSRRARLPDILATLALFTARSIEDAYRRHVLRRHRLTEVVVSGGGAKNLCLMKRLQELLSPLPIVTSERYGLPVMAKEAACFAWLAARAISGKPNNCPTATGARGRRVLGKIIPI